MSDAGTVTAKPGKVEREDLMRDSRVRSVVTENLFHGMLMGPIVVLSVSAIFWYQFVAWPEPVLLICALLAWSLNAIFYLSLYLHYHSRKTEWRHQAEITTRYLNALTYSRYIDSLGGGVITLLLFKIKPDWVLLEIVGLIMYCYGAYVKNMSYSPLTKYSAVLLFAPMTAELFLLGGALNIIIAVYFILSAMGLNVYSKNIANIIQLPIKQRFELEELTSQLNIERDRADAANAAKSHFFTAASHDARQPLQVISLLFQSFQKSTQASDQDKKIIEKIDVNLRTIRNLFDRVLDISRIDSGNVTPNMQPVRLQTLFDKFDAQFGELAASKGLWLRFVPTEACVEHDVELLDRMVSNLVHNAIKYTPAGGVWVAWRTARGRLEVRDSGLGISESNQQTIFDEFAQLNNPARNNEAGLGLGLSIVKRLADLTETPLGLNSKINKGSTFWMQLKTTVAEMSPSLPAQSGFATDKVVLTASRGEQLLGMHILYAEDEPQIRELFRQMLQDAGAVVYPCANVTDAIAVVNTKLAIDIVLTDYRLGATGTGLDVVHAVRTRQTGHGLNNLPAVILTGDTAVKDLLSIQQLTSSTLLHKPVDFEQLVSTLKTVTRYREYSNIS